MMTIRRALPVAVALTFVLAACGGSSDGEDTEETGTTEAAATTADESDDFGEAATAEDGDGETAGDTVADEAPADTSPEAPAETVTPEDTVAEDPDEAGAATTSPSDDTGTGDAADLGVSVTLTEWALAAPTEYTAGEITFNTSNGGSFPHELVVIEGEGYEALPLAESGAVLEDELPTGALIGRTGRIGGGADEALTVSLAPGTYVLVCNLGAGANSHAGQGQRLDITVS